MKSVFNTKNIDQGDRKQTTKILLVDDEDYNLTALKIILKYHIRLDVDKLCDEAVNGQEAFKAVKNKSKTMDSNSKPCQYELILMDCNMPIMDGYEATKKIRKFLNSKGLNQPVIAAITGHTEQSYIQKAIQSGMNQVICKPASADTLH